MDDPEDRTLPTSLRVIAWFTILCGIGSVIHVITALAHKRIYLNFGVLQIPAGFGLLRLSQGWRTFELILLWIGFIGAIILVPMLALGKLSVDNNSFGMRFPELGREISLAISAVWVGFSIWEYRVLTSPRVRRLFGLPDFPRD